MTDDLTTRLRRYGEVFDAAVTELPIEPKPAGGARSGRRVLVLAVAVVLVGLVTGVVLIGGSRPERVRTVVPPSTSRPTPAPVACPGTPVDSARTAPDGLPAATSRTTSRAHVAEVARAAGPALRSHYPGTTSITVGPGGGYQWASGPSGSITVDHVADWAIHVGLAERAQCPKPGPLLDLSYDGVDVVFFAPPGHSAIPPSTPSTLPASTLPGAAAVVAQLALPHLTMRSGSAMSVLVMVDNRSGHALDVPGCKSLFQVWLTSRTVPKASPMWFMCRQDLTVPTGESTYRIPLLASYEECGGIPLGHNPACVNGRTPGLPPGTYQAELFQNPQVAVAPQPVTVRVTG